MTLCFDGWYAPGHIDRDAHAAYLAEADAHLIGLVEDDRGWIGVLYVAETPLVAWHEIAESLAPTVAQLVSEPLSTYKRNQNAREAHA